MSTAVGAVRLTLLHAKYSLIETLRIPIAVIGTIVFPTLALLFFVVPNRAVADNAVWATQAIISLSVFAVMTNGLFSFGITVADNREKPWDPFLRTLPAPGVARIFAQVFSTGLLGFVAILPIILVGGLLTAAQASPTRIILGLAALAFAAMPFMMLGTCLGYAFPPKAAIAVVQVVMFGLAFGGGLFIPPEIFAPWLEQLSRWFPSRQAREFVIWAATGGDLPWWAWVGLLAWTLVFTGLAVLLFRRDEGRRYR